MKGDDVSLTRLFASFATILGPDRGFYWLAAVYGIGIGLLSLATPVSVQMLINTVANTGLTTPLVVLSLTLFGLLLLAGLFNALRIHLMDLFGRRFYSRMVAEIALRSIYAQNPFFLDDNKGTLFNRYFDIIIVLKMVPNLVVGGFTVVLQAVVGFVLVSLYHPLFLAFNLIVVASIWLAWLLFGRRAIRSAVEVSHRKHRAASWIESLGTSNGFFKSKRTIDAALDRTDTMTAEYIEAHRLHFRHHFAQTVSLLFVYAAASAALLGLGGWLVIQGQLSLGQLVAAELVLSVVYFSVSQFGVYLTYFYDLCGAIDELSLFWQIDQEEPIGDHERLECRSDLRFAKVRGDARGRPVTLDFSLPGGARLMARAESQGLQRIFTDLLTRHELPQGGYIGLGDTDIRAIKAHALRQEVIVLDRPSSFDMTIREYLRLSSRDDTGDAPLRALSAVGLADVIAEFPQGLDTRMSVTGWPLSIGEVLALKLAAALLAAPRVLVLNQLFDLLPDAPLLTAFEALQRNSGTTIVYFSDRPRELGFDRYFFLGYSQQPVVASPEEFGRLAQRVGSRSEARRDARAPAEVAAMPER